MNTVINGILDDAGVIITPIQAVPEIDAIGREVGVGCCLGNIIGITDIPSFAAVGAKNRK